MVRRRLVSVTLLANLFGVGSFGVARGTGEVRQTLDERNKKKGRHVVDGKNLT